MKQKVIRWCIYGLGLVILALGITLNTKTGLGVSPIVSPAFAVSQISGWSFGNTTLALYTILLIVELVLKGRNARLTDLLQLPLSIVFTRFMNLFSDSIPMQTQLTGQLAVLAVAIVLTGIGGAMSVDVRLIPNPGDGVVQAISDFTGKEMGFCKNCVDGTMVALALAISLLLRHTVLGIGIGTVAALLGTGRVVALFNKLFLKKLLALSGME